MAAPEGESSSCMPETLLGMSEADWPGFAGYGRGEIEKGQTVPLYDALALIGKNCLIGQPPLMAHRAAVNAGEVGWEWSCCRLNRPDSPDAV